MAITIKKQLVFSVDDSKDTVKVSPETAQKIQQIMNAKQSDLLQGGINGLHQDIAYSPNRESLIWRILGAILNGKAVIQ